MPLADTVTVLDVNSFLPLAGRSTDVPLQRSNNLEKCQNPFPILSLLSLLVIWATNIHRKVYWWCFLLPWKRPQRQASVEDSNDSWQMYCLLISQPLAGSCLPCHQRNSNLGWGGRQGSKGQGDTCCRGQQEEHSRRRWRRIAYPPCRERCRVQATTRKRRAGRGKRQCSAAGHHWAINSPSAAAWQRYLDCEACLRDLLWRDGSAATDAAQLLQGLPQLQGGVDTCGKLRPGLSRAPVRTVAVCQPESRSWRAWPGALPSGSWCQRRSQLCKTFL